MSSGDGGPRDQLCPALSQLGLGLPGLESGLGAKDGRVKDGMRKVHADLVEKGFMVKLEDMAVKTREMIKNAPFQHYNPWRLVMKMDSMTTPVRMVLDPTMTSFNKILAKRENNIGSLFTIMIRCKCTEYIWS